MSTSETDYDESFITLADAERIAVETGEWRGTDVHFSNDGAQWAEYWLPDDENPHPRLARAVVKRRQGDDIVSTTVVASWDEYYPDDDPERAAQWDKLKTVLLSKVAVVATYRRAFRDKIGKRFEPAEMHQASKPARDFLTELAEVTTLPDLEALYAEARTAKAFVGEGGDELQKAFVQRMDDIDPVPEVEPERVHPSLGNVPDAAPKPKPPQHRTRRRS